MRCNKRKQKVISKLIRRTFYNSKESLFKLKNIKQKEFPLKTFYQSSHNKALLQTPKFRTLSIYSKILK